MRRLLAAAWLVAAVAGAPAEFVRAEPPSFERGRMLYENHCRVCHTEKVHARTPRLALNRQELREIVMKWVEQENLPWRREEVEDVVHFLNLTRYHY